MSLTTTLSKNKEPVYFHREYKNDVSEKATQNSWIDQGKRFALVSLPFVSLYRPISSHLALGLGALRTVSSVSQLVQAIHEGKRKDISYQFLQTTIAAVSLAGTIFAHPIGMLITTGQDLIIEANNLASHLQAGRYQEAMVSCASIINNSLYLGMIFYGGLELSISSLAMQIMIGLYHTQSEFQKGNNLEGTGHLLIVMMRGNQLVAQVNILQKRWELATFLQKANQTMLTKSSQVEGNNRNSVMDPEELSKLVKLPFSSPTKFTFNIRDTNNKGESVGEAFFLENRQQKCIAWYWSPQTGFDVIATKEIFINHRTDINEFFTLAKEQSFPAVGFTGLKINNEGVVAGSVELWQMFPDKQRKYFWYWWSKDQGIHASSLISNPTYIAYINDSGNALLTHPCKPGSCSITNIQNMDKFLTLQYPTKDDIEKPVVEWLVEYCTNPHNMVPGREHVSRLNHKWTPNDQNRLMSSWFGPVVFSADKLLADGSVHGTIRGACYLRSKGVNPERCWPNLPIYLNIHFTIDSSNNFSLKEFSGK